MGKIGDPILRDAVSTKRNVADRSSLKMQVGINAGAPPSSYDAITGDADPKLFRGHAQIFPQTVIMWELKPCSAMNVCMSSLDFSDAVRR